MAESVKVPTSPRAVLAVYLPMIRPWKVWPLVLLAALGCKKAETVEPAPAESAEHEATPDHSASGPAPLASADHYSVPFAWEASDDEPLAKVRGFLGSAVKTNAEYGRDHSKAFFDAIREQQKPRATVVLCSDSRVQVNVLDDTPENDVFVIRDIGNSIGTAAGSIEYGVRHLHTPLLLIVGHTGCGAVKAGLAAQRGEGHGLEPAIKDELASLFLTHGQPIPAGKGPAGSHGEAKPEPAHAPDAKDSKDAKGSKDSKAKDTHAPDPKDAAQHPTEDAHAEKPKGAQEGRTAADGERDFPIPLAKSLGAEEEAWAQGVAANVDGQVRLALDKYGRELAKGQLVVVGAIYDFRNDLGQGYGKLVVINVNGNTDPKRIEPFLAAIASRGKGHDADHEDDVADDTDRAIAAIEALADAEGRKERATPKKRQEVTPEH